MEGRPDRFKDLRASLLVDFADQRVGLLRVAGARVEADADEPRVVAVDERHRAAIAGQLAERIGVQRFDVLLDLVCQVKVGVLVDGEAGEHGAPRSVGVGVASIVAAVG